MNPRSSRYAMRTFQHEAAAATMAARRRRTIASVAAAVVLALAAIAPIAQAGQPVTQALNPAPPDIYTCAATGDGTICRASTSEPYGPDPTGIFCGSGSGSFEVLDQGTENVEATRWYDRDGNLTRRALTITFAGSRVSNPLTGLELGYHQRNIDVDVLAVPGDLATATTYQHGVLSINVPGLGTVLLEAGRDIVNPDGTVDIRSGPSEISDYDNGDVHAVDALCAALAA
jgi:hypothetical protein